jgi:hypothetical protein
MLSRDTVQHWLDDYVAAWRSYDAEAIRALFAPQATYAYEPWGGAAAGPGCRRRVVARGPRRARLVGGDVLAGAARGQRRDRKGRDRYLEQPTT